MNIITLFCKIDFFLAYEKWQATQCLPKETPSETAADRLQRKAMYISNTSASTGAMSSHIKFRAAPIGKLLVSYLSIPGDCQIASSQTLLLENIYGIFHSKKS